MDRSRLPLRLARVRTRNRRWWGTLALIALVLLGDAASAVAQTGRGRNRPQPSQPGPTPTAPAAPPEPWPRLDSGALLCKTRDDLVKYQRRVADGPEAMPGPAPDCAIIRKQLPIKIVEQDGPSRTQVIATDDSKQSGWTNAYLPPTPPTSTSGAGRGGTPR